MLCTEKYVSAHAAHAPELSSSPRFQDCYFPGMALPNTLSSPHICQRREHSSLAQCLQASGREKQAKPNKTNNTVNKTGAGKHAHVVESQSRTSSLSNQGMETPCHHILWRILSFSTTENSPLCFSFCELSWRTVLHQKKKPTALSSTFLGYET